MTLAYNMYRAAEAAAAKAAAEAVAKAAAKAAAEAREKALKEGREEGEHKKAVETAKSMKSENMSVSMIAHFTGLSVEEIEKL